MVRLRRGQMASVTVTTDHTWGVFFVLRVLT